MSEAATATQAEASDTKELVLGALPLVHYAVNDLAMRIPSHVNRDDLVGAGMLGLAQAARSWDPERGVTFERFARTRIRGALLDELRGRDWATRSVRAKARHLHAATEEHTRTTTGAPTSAQLAAAMGMSTAELAHLTAEVHRSTVLPFDAIFADPDDAPVGTDVDEPLEAVLQRERLDHLRDAVTCLPERLRKVVVEYFFEQRQMQDIADDLGVTESRVSQLRADALVLLRAGMQTASGDVRPEPAAEGTRRTRRAAAYLAEVAAASNASAVRAAAPVGSAVRSAAIA
jgi:RNA polymerase sigma factor for flagellar operon FliA